MSAFLRAVDYCSALVSVDRGKHERGWQGLPRPCEWWPLMALQQGLLGPRNICVWGAVGNRMHSANKAPLCCCLMCLTRLTCAICLAPQHYPLLALYSRPCVCSVFPAVGHAAVLTQAKIITDDMFLVAADELAKVCRGNACIFTRVPAGLRVHRAPRPLPCLPRPRRVCAACCSPPFKQNHVHARAHTHTAQGLSYSVLTLFFFSSHPCSSPPLRRLRAACCSHPSTRSPACPAS